MPRNGSGVYGPPAGTLVPNTPIESAKYNAFVADVSEALTKSANVDGTAPYQANQPMGGNKLTGLGAGSAAGDSANIGQIQSDIVAHATAVSGSGDAITLTFSPPFAAYTAKMRFRFTAGAANTIMAPTVNVDSLGAKLIKKMNGQALEVNDILGAGHVCECVYDGTDVILLNPGFWPGRANTFSAKQTFSRPVVTSMTTLTDAATIAWDMASTSNDVKILLTASRILGIPTNIQTGMKGLLVVQMDGTGGWSLTPNAVFDLPGDQAALDLDKAANAQTIYEYEVVEDHAAAQKIRLHRVYSTGRNSVGFYRDFDFGLFVGSAPGQLAPQAHGLGRMPTDLRLIIECVVADGGYLVGDRIYGPAGVNDSSTGDFINAGVNLGCDANNVWITVGLAMLVKAKTTGGLRPRNKQVASLVEGIRMSNPVVDKKWHIDKTIPLVGDIDWRPDGRGDLVGEQPFISVSALEENKITNANQVTQLNGIAVDVAVLKENVKTTKDDISTMKNGFEMLMQQVLQDKPRR